MRFHRSATTRCLFVGPLRIRWAGSDFRPLFSERYGHRKWLKIGRLGFRWDMAKPITAAPADPETETDRSEDRDA